MRLVCKGEMPDDFKMRYSAQYQETLDEDDERVTRSKKNFAAIVNFALNELIRSGKVIYGDEISTYCNMILDSLLFDQPELRKQLRVYCVRSVHVNAFSTHQGIIFITSGLVARLNSEAELAFILAHEISHYVARHVLASYDYTRELFKSDVKNRKSTFDEKFLETAKYSREAEFEADSAGLEIFLNAGYDPEQAISSFATLDGAALPVVSQGFNYAAVEDAYFKLDKPSDSHPELSESDPDEFDSLSSHPTNAERIKKIRSYLENVRPEKGQSASKTKRVFREVTNRAKSDVLYNHIIQAEYFDAMIICDVWLNSPGMDKAMLQRARAMSYYGIAKLLSIMRVHERPYDDMDTNEMTYYKMFKGLSLDKLYLLSCRELWKIYQLDTNQVFVSNLLDDCIIMLVKYNKNNPVADTAVTFDSIPKYKLIKPKLLDIENVRSLGFSSQKSELTKSVEQLTKPWWHEINLALVHPDFKGLKERITHVAYRHNADEYADTNQLTTQDPSTELAYLNYSEEFSEINVYDRYNKKIRLTSDNLKVNKMMALSPQYFGFDFTKAMPKRFRKNDQIQQELEQSMNEFSDELGIELVLLDSRSDTVNATEKFNRYMVIMDWMNERRKYDVDTYHSFIQKDINLILETSGTNYLSFAMFTNYSERNRLNIPLGITSLILGFPFPFYLYWQFVPNNHMSYAFMVLNIETGEIDHLDVREYKRKYRNYLGKAYLYESLNSIKP